MNYSHYCAKHISNTILCSINYNKYTVPFINITILYFQDKNCQNLYKIALQTKKNRSVLEKFSLSETGTMVYINRNCLHDLRLVNVWCTERVYLITR